MKKILIYFSLIAGFNVQAQTDVPKESGSEIYWNIGAHSPYIQPLNDLIVAAGFPMLKTTSYSAGFSYVQFSKKDIVTEQELFYYNLQSKNDSLTSNMRNISYGFSLFGYRYMDRKKLKMFSTVGLIFNNSRVNVFENLSNDNSVASYLSGTANQHEMNTFNYNLNGTTHINYYISFKKSTTQLILGARAAYYLPLTTTKWSMDNAKLNNGPKINPGGYAVHLSIGMTL
jgi:hypothetical protein